MYIAYRDPRCPWYARVITAVVVVYALSPIDLIPDFIPVLGYLDDLILVPLGIAAARKLIPEPLMSDSREKARAIISERLPRKWGAVPFILLAWAGILAAVYSARRVFIYFR